MHDAVSKWYSAATVTTVISTALVTAQIKLEKCHVEKPISATEIAEKGVSMQPFVRRTFELETALMLLEKQNLKIK